MSIEADPDKGQQEDKNEEIEVKPPEAKKPSKTPNEVRMAEALKKLQEEKAELEKYKTEAERAKLSDSERAKAEAADLKKEVEKLTRENAIKEVEIKLRDQVDNLVEAGLDGRKFGKTVLAEWDEENETFDDFVKRAKEDKDLKRFFKPEGEIERPKAPEPPGQGSKRANKAMEASAEEKEWAKRTYPGNEALQKRVLEQLKAAKKKRAEEEAE